ncbi:urocanate hydratase [Platysternon megacephalum]|uniref:Urocanate hydratase n=1 Tax=Platysternon megacephalum TaxID=55544 RepID=A0A4D9DFK4_9SAUR|nr:urocanate hydratase [Platysternon megacephalum]
MDLFIDPLGERRAPLRDEGEAAEAEGQRQSEELLGAGRSGGSREDGAFRKPEPGFAELEKRLGDFSLQSAHLQQVLLGFKETLRRDLGSDTGTCLSLTGPGEISDP